MSEKKATVEAVEQEERPDLKIAVQKEDNSLPGKPRTAQEIYLARKQEVAEHDYKEFLQYQHEKDQQERTRQSEAEQAQGPNADSTTERPPPGVNRRSLLSIVAGTAAVAEAGALGYVVKTQGISSQGLKHAGDSYVEVQRHNIERELINPKADIGQRGFGDWVLLLPTKMAGGTYAVSLNSGRCLAWISYWPYGDYNPISHHLCAFPSAEPSQGFEFINSTQGGKNSLIYGIPTKLDTPAEGFNIYRVRYDGSQMEVMENVAETTGLGLGVHVTIDPKTAERYFVTDGQKDIAACFDRRSSRVLAALKFDWEPNELNLRTAWQNGGTLKISKIYPDAETGKFDYLGTKGQKIEWEMVPMGELFVEEGTLPGDDPLHLCGADGTIWHPSGRWASTIIRLCGGQLILDAEKNFQPVTFIAFNKSAPDHYEVKQTGRDSWEVILDKVFSPGHEVGFSPDGRFCCMMNNLRENNCSVFDSSDADPCKWKKVAHIEDPLWGGKYPNPFHMVFSMDGSKLYLSILHPSPARSGVMVIDTNTWKIKKEIQGIGPDMQTLAITYDGKYVVGVFSGFQRLESGIAFIDAETDELVGIWPSNGGHHDCVIIPRELEHMKHTRSCTL